jgi:hypothetical protein
MLFLVLLAFLLGPFATGLGEWVDEGGTPLSVFGLLIVAAGLLLRAVSKEVEAIAFAEHRPWLRHGRIRQWQKLILPFDSATILGTSLTCVMAGGTVLLTSTPAWSTLNVLSLGFVAVGGLLMGFGLSRLGAGLVLVHRSGFWGASRRAWLVAGSVVTVGTIIGGAYTVRTILEIVPGL